MSSTVKEVRLSARTSEKGELVIDTVSKQQMKDNCFQHRNCSVIITLSFEEPGCSPQKLAYYRKKALPDIQAAFHATGERILLKDLDLRLRSMFPVTADGDHIKEVEELSDPEMKEYLDCISQYAAENLYLIL